jgi:hypothetical protein
VQDLTREQIVFDITQLSQKRLDTGGKHTEPEETSLSVDADQQLRAVLSKLRDYCVSLEALDEHRTFNSVIEPDDALALDPDVRRQWVGQWMRSCCQRWTNQAVRVFGSHIEVSCRTS